MTATPEIQDQIKRYLLGELDDGTRAQVEQKLLSDGEVFEELLVAEDEIIDDYASGRLDLEEATEATICTSIAPPCNDPRERA